MNTDQIAAEAHSELHRLEQLGGSSYQPIVVTGIIKAAIEKATELVRKFWKDTYDTCYATLQSERAAHASEPWTWQTVREIANVCGGINQADQAIADAHNAAIEKALEPYSQSNTTGRWHKSDTRAAPAREPWTEKT